MEYKALMLSMFVADIISCVEFNADGELLATGDKGGRVVIFQRDQIVTIFLLLASLVLYCSARFKETIVPLAL